MLRFITALLLGLATLAPSIAFAETRAVDAAKLAANWKEFPSIQAADCSAASAGYTAICHETADDSLWFCESTSGCPAANWVQVGGGGSASSLVDGDYGDWTCATGVCTLDNDVVAPAEIADADFGDFTCTTGVCTLDVSIGAATTYNASWAVPTTSDDLYIKVGGGSITLTNFDCIAIGGTTPSALIITVDECTSAGATCVSSGGTVTLSAVTTSYNDATFTDAAIDDNDWIRFDITSLTTSPDYAFCRLEFTQP